MTFSMKHKGKMVQLEDLHISWLDSFLTDNTQNLIVKAASIKVIEKKPRLEFLNYAQKTLEHAFYPEKMIAVFGILSRKYNVHYEWHALDKWKKLVNDKIKLSNK